jgi:GNAT superfamily N-acetyltransferase
MLAVIRTMKPDDIDSAMELTTVANWNQMPEDWRRIMQLSREGCQCIEHSGRVVSTASLLAYGTQLAWIGMVLTLPEFRSQGFARQLVEDVVSIADRNGVRTLKLDATDQGRPLYESLGFVVEQTVERWSRDGVTTPAVNGTAFVEDSSNRPSHCAQISDELFCLDQEAFGVDRRALLELLSASSAGEITRNGYVLSRTGRSAEYLGPCVARSAAEARQLIAARLERPTRTSAELSRGWYWDLLPANSKAVSCATELGFTRQRVLCRMRRGEVIGNNDAMVYAIAGFELG